MPALSEKHCAPCEGGVPTLTRAQAEALMPDVPGWSISEDGAMKITRALKCKNFVAAMKFVNAVARLAEEENHHPDILINYSRVTLTLWTHAIGGLCENDFILAAKINALPAGS